MSTEQRLSAAFRNLDRYEPSEDLWSRVLYSIDEDREHRRRLRRTTITIVAVVAAAIAIALLTMTTPLTNSRRVLDWRIVELLETGILVAAIATLGPAIRRFGRGYVHELFVTSRSTGDHLLRLLDVAYYLVFSGYVLQTAEFEAPRSFLLGRPWSQLQEALARIAELLLGMGLLHAATIAVLPLIALVFNSTQRNARLPRWVSLLLLAVGGGAVLVLLIMVPLGVA